VSPTTKTKKQPVIRVHLSDPACRDVLVDHLVESGCVPAPVGKAAIDVVHPEAHDAEEARKELVFFLRAWQVTHPDVELTFAA
jgi:hypothetical protein